MSKEAIESVGRVVNGIFAQEMLNNVRRQREIPQYLQREIYQDVFNYLVKYYD